MEIQELAAAAKHKRGGNKQTQATALRELQKARSKMLAAGTPELKMPSREKRTQDLHATIDETSRLYNAMKGLPDQDLPRGRTEQDKQLRAAMFDSKVDAIAQMLSRPRREVEAEVNAIVGMQTTAMQRNLLQQCHDEHLALGRRLSPLEVADEIRFVDKLCKSPDVKHRRAMYTPVEVTAAAVTSRLLQRSVTEDEQKIERLRRAYSVDSRKAEAALQEAEWDVAAAAELLFKGKAKASPPPSANVTAKNPLAYSPASKAELFNRARKATGPPKPTKKPSDLRPVFIDHVQSQPGQAVSPGQGINEGDSNGKDPRTRQRAANAEPKQRDAEAAQVDIHHCKVDIVLDARQEQANQDNWARAVQDEFKLLRHRKLTDAPDEFEACRQGVCRTCKLWTPRVSAGAESPTCEPCIKKRKSPEPKVRQVLAGPRDQARTAPQTRPAVSQPRTKGSKPSVQSQSKGKSCSPRQAKHKGGDRNRTSAARQNHTNRPDGGMWFSHLGEGTREAQTQGPGIRAVGYEATRACGFDNEQAQQVMTSLCSVLGWLAMLTVTVGSNCLTSTAVAVLTVALFNVIFGYSVSPVTPAVVLLGMAIGLRCACARANRSMWGRARAAADRLARALGDGRQVAARREPFTRWDCLFTFLNPGWRQTFQRNFMRTVWLAVFLLVIFGFVSPVSGGAVAGVAAPFVELGRGVDFALGACTLLDSGASRVMLKEKQWFVDGKLSRAQVPLKVKIADGSITYYYYCGPAVLPVVDAVTQKTHKIYLKEAWLSESAAFNLISVSALTKAGYNVMFKEGGSVIYNDQNVIQVDSRNKLFYLDLEGADNTPTDGDAIHFAMVKAEQGVSLAQWHARLSHAGVSQIERMAKMTESSCPVTGLNVSSYNKCMCEACILSKMRDDTHPSKTTHKAFKMYEVLWTDLEGPLSQPTRNGEKYILGLMDEKSRWLWVFLLKTKDEAVNVVNDFLTEHPEVAGLVQVVKSDQGGEYRTQFENMLGRHQVKHWMTPANCPAARGTIERVWGTIMPMMACNLRYAGMVDKGADLWGFALKYAVWVYNRLPHAGDKLTPFEHRHKQKPDLKHAKVWGCPAYAYIPVDKQQKDPAKLKSIKGVFLGRHETGEVTTDGALILSDTGELISSGVTTYCEDWNVSVGNPANSPEPAERTTPKGKRIALSLFDGMSGLLLALQKANRLHEFDCYIAVEKDRTARMVSKAVHVNVGSGIPVHHEWVTDVFELTEELVKSLGEGNIALLAAGPLCEQFSKKRLFRDFRGRIPTEDPREGLQGEKGKTFLATLDAWHWVKKHNPDASLFVENVQFDDMPDDWEAICSKIGQPYLLNAQNYSYTRRNRAYWTDGTIHVPPEALRGGESLDWNECMDTGRTIKTVRSRGQDYVPPIGKSWHGDPDNPKENTGFGVKVRDKELDTLTCLRPHEAEKLMGMPEHVTSGNGITALARLRAIGNGWDINTTSKLLAYLPTAGGAEADGYVDWCLQFKPKDKVRVFCDSAESGWPTGWYNGVVEYVSESKGEIKVEYPDSNTFTTHDLDDGNVQPAEVTDEKTVRFEVGPQAVLDELTHSDSRRRVLHTLKTRPDRWGGSTGGAKPSNKPFLAFQRMKWASHHKTNPKKGEKGHVTSKAFQKAVVEAWEKHLQNKTNLHRLAKSVDQNSRKTASKTGGETCPHCGKAAADFVTQNSFQSHKSRCRSRPCVATAVVATEGSEGMQEPTYRVDCEQAGSDWGSCHGGQESMGALNLTGQLPLSERDIGTAFVLSEGYTEVEVTEKAKTFETTADWGKVCRRVTTDLETGSIVQDAEMPIAAAVAEVSRKFLQRGADIEVDLIPDAAEGTRKIVFANAAVEDKKRAAQRMAKGRQTARNPLEPRTMAEALQGPDKEKWAKAIDDEWNSLVDEGVFTIVDRDKVARQNIITSKWVFKIKSDGRYKARCVGRGFQQWNSTIDSNFAPVARLGTARVLFALAAMFDLDLWQQDVVTAFLNARLGAGQEIYMELPDCYADQFQGKVLKLNKAIYGLKNSPRLWNRTFDEFLGELGFEPTAQDACLYVLREKVDGKLHYVYLLVYVDDILLVSTSKNLRQRIREQLKRRFNMSQKVDNVPAELLGMRVTVGEDTVELDQSSYALEIYKNYRDYSVDVRAANTPMKDKVKFTALDADPEYMKGKDYRGVIGSLLYLTMGTRPDICFAVKELSRYLDKAGEPQWKAVQHLLEYVHNTNYFAIRYSKPEASRRLNLTAHLQGYSDADWASQTEDRRSTSAYVYFLAGGPVSWSSKTQKSVALSTAEAEYMALSDASKECVHLKGLLQSMDVEQEEIPTIFEDNQSAQKIAENPVMHDRTKHIDIRYHFVRELVEAKQIDIMYISTADMIADLLTKAVSRSVFQRLIGPLFGQPTLSV